MYIVDICYESSPVLERDKNSVCVKIKNCILNCLFSFFLFQNKNYIPIVFNDHTRQFAGVSLLKPCKVRLVGGIVPDQLSNHRVGLAQWLACPPLTR